MTTNRITGLCARAARLPSKQTDPVLSPRSNRNPALRIGQFQKIRDLEEL